MDSPGGSTRVQHRPFNTPALCGFRGRLDPPTHTHTCHIIPGEQLATALDALEWVRILPLSPPPLPPNHCATLPGPLGGDHVVLSVTGGGSYIPKERFRPAREAMEINRRKGRPGPSFTGGGGGGALGPTEGPGGSPPSASPSRTPRTLPTTSPGVWLLEEPPRSVSDRETGDPGGGGPTFETLVDDRFYKSLPPTRQYYSKSVYRI